MFSLLRNHPFSKVEKIILAVAFVGFLLSLLILSRRFYYQSSVLLPSTGGTYIEGSVGELQPLNPWFTVENDVNRDIVSLVFSGLLKYNPETKKIEEDLATLTVSPDSRVYTVKLKEDLFWHDSTEEYPHPVTPEDVLFTFQTIQDPAFPNSLLRQNFLGVDIEILDDRRIQFLLEEPYSFFASNLTLGILPKDSFEGVPVGKLDQALDFAFSPIGAGPYKFKSLIQTELSTEITLERFDRPVEPTFLLESIVFRVFPDYATLLSDIRNLDGIRNAPRNELGEPVIPKSFKANEYSLPQYVALFFNLETEFLEDQNLRLGLQLGTNKKKIIDSIGESIIVDTPLLEIDVSDWRYQYDAVAAQGALFASDWHLPEKVRLQRLLEIKEANDIGDLQLDPIVLLDTGAILTVEGSFGDNDSLFVNGLQVEQTETGSWISALPTTGGTGSLREGENLLRLTTDDGDIIDSFYIWRTTSPSLYNRASEEQRLLELFIESRKEDHQGPNSVTYADLYLEKGMLRRRLSTDPHDIRINDGGEKLSLRLLTSASPPQYEKLANEIQSQWAELGVHIGIDVPETREEFEKKLLNRDYDVLLFGQSLLDNLDSYPYWHSSGIQSGEDHKELRLDAYNLSQYSSLEADSLLEQIRSTQNEDQRAKALESLREILKVEVPAVFLYSPLYTYAYQKDIRGIDLGTLSQHSDRFLTLHNWFLKEKRSFLPGKSWWSFVPWLFGF